MSFFRAVNPHLERHGAARAGWLRAAVLGANDGLVSTASLMVGVAASGAATGTVVTAGLAGVAPGPWRWPPASTCRSAPRSTWSGPTGTGGAGAGREPGRRAGGAGRDLRVARGAGRPCPPGCGRLARNDPLQAHLRDELGHSDATAARPLQASVASAVSFLIGGLVPFLGLLAPTARHPAGAHRGGDHVRARRRWRPGRQGRRGRRAAPGTAGADRRRAGDGHHRCSRPDCPRLGTLTRPPP